MTSCNRAPCYGQFTTRRPHTMDSIVCGRLVVNWPAQTQCTRLFMSVDGRNGRLQDNKPTTVTCHPSLSSKNAWNSDLAHVISFLQGSCR